MRLVNAAPANAHAGAPAPGPGRGWRPPSRTPGTPCRASRPAARRVSRAAGWSCVASRRVRPSSISTVPIIPHRWLTLREQVAEQVGGGGLAVGPGDAQHAAPCRLGSPWNRLASSETAAAGSATTTCGIGHSRALAVTTAATAPRSRASRRNDSAVGLGAGPGDEQVAGDDLPGIFLDPGDGPAGDAPEADGRVERAGVIHEGASGHPFPNTEGGDRVNVLS